VRKILIIDDDASLREIVARALKKHAYESIQAENGRAGVSLAREHLPDVILGDIQMGSFDGYAALSAIRFEPATATIPFILMTGAPDENGRRMAMELGADDYMAKPFTVQSLLIAIQAQLKKREAILKQISVARLSDADQAEIRSIEETISNPGAPDSMVLGDPTEALGGEFADLEVFLRMLSLYHPNLGSVARRMVALCREIGRTSGLSSDETGNLVRAAALCDISMVGISHSVVRRWLRDPNTLRPEEWSLISEHPEQSGQFLKAWPNYRGLREIIRSHHEYWDGSGYPDGLVGDKIPIASCLLAAAHFYCSRYEPADQVLSELWLHAGSLFDQEAVEAVAKAVPTANLPTGEREILLTELRAGVVLARDLRNASGVVLLPRGRLITEATVARLLVISRSRPVDQNVLVCG
jgi:response regulator RpfG family c-di-GMP phosphodiesterase